MTYLCYDLKGIQSFIFAVPRLRYICGGSAIIDRFDRGTAQDVNVTGAKLLFAGGGKGAFRCDDCAAAEKLQASLVEEAHKEGVGICFGRHSDYSEAANLANQSFPYLPDKSELDGQPCQESGLYPTQPQKIHPMIAGRVRRKGEPKGDRLDRYFEKVLLKGLTLPPGLDAEQCEFFHDVDATSDTGRFACAALGGRNRWAIICMDGNDMGAQHREAAQRWGQKETTYTTWLGKMSKALDDCSRKACRDAMQHVIDAWAKDEEEMRAATDGSSAVILPLRPLVVGGDDIIVLCHVRHAMEFVREACRSFTERSEWECQEARKQGVELWPASKSGGLTISAGILYAPVSLPLASAIPYAESLLASAKCLGRKRRPYGEATPACVDWECVTEGLIDTPHARRQRELRFSDGDLDGEIVELTRRPYTISDIGDLMKLVKDYREVPPAIRHQVLPAMRSGYWDRQVFTARLGKHHEALAEALDEGGDREHPKGRWKREKDKNNDKIYIRSTDVVDPLLLLEEDARMNWITAEAKK